MDAAAVRGFTRNNGAHVSRKKNDYFGGEGREAMSIQIHHGPWPDKTNLVVVETEDHYRGQNNCWRTSDSEGTLSAESSKNSMNTEGLIFSPKSPNKCEIHLSSPKKNIFLT